LSLLFPDRRTIEQAIREDLKRLRERSKLVVWVLLAVGVFAGWRIVYWIIKAVAQAYGLGFIFPDDPLYPPH
jgi:membrane-anchored glycerophosphoryl diester phosphodiesterase (GDPDase)